jgi:hypothetical protein
MGRACPPFNPLLVAVTKPRYLYHPYDWESGRISASAHEFSGDCPFIVEGWCVSTLAVYILVAMLEISAQTRNVCALEDLCSAAVTCRGGDGRGCLSDRG